MHPAASILSLILGYNGLGRLAGQAGGPQNAAGGAGLGDGGAGGVFGGETGPLRLLDASLGGQAGWLLGAAIVAGLGLLAATRLRRTDARTGWLIAVGGAFATTAVAFSAAEGIFHPYYVSLLAPFTAALVGAGVGQVLAGGRAARIVGPLMLAAGIATELAVLAHDGTSPGWLPPVLIAGGLVAAVALAGGPAAKLRRAALAAGLALLLLAPAAWSVQTLGHATSGTFPAGGPATASFGGGGGPGGRARAGPAARRRSSGAGTDGGSGGRGSAAPARSRRGMMPGAGAGGASGGGMPGGFGGDTGALTEALAYAKAHGGGTVAVSSQSGAAGAIVNSGADVVAIGGFSGRESEVDAAWLAEAVESGKVHWVLTDGSGGFGAAADGRTGSRSVTTAVEQTCQSVASNDGLYDCSGSAAALAAAT